MTVRWTVRATEPTAVFSPQRKYKTVGSSPREPSPCLSKSVQRAKTKDTLSGVFFIFAMKIKGDGLRIFLYFNDDE